MNAQPHQLSKIGEFGIWELVPQVATITVGVLDMWTNFFQREAEDLVLLFQYTDGDSRGCVLSALSGFQDNPCHNPYTGWFEIVT